jgi:hypothetical protein
MVVRVNPARRAASLVVEIIRKIGVMEPPGLRWAPGAAYTSRFDWRGGEGWTKPAAAVWGEPIRRFFVGDVTIASSIADLLSLRAKRVAVRVKKTHQRSTGTALLSMHD